MKERIYEATDENLEPVQNFVMETIKEAGCTTEHEIWLMIAIEEIYVNIAHYAYAPAQGQATIRCAVEGDPKRVIVQFIDRGKPFNPLAKKDADITLSAEERGIGGLGILMVKQSMDDVTYSREEGQNILTLQKIL